MFIPVGFQCNALLVCLYKHEKNPLVFKHRIFLQRSHRLRHVIVRCAQLSLALPDVDHTPLQRLMDVCACQLDMGDAEGPTEQALLRGSGWADGICWGLPFRRIHSVAFLVLVGGLEHFFVLPCMYISIYTYIYIYMYV